MSTQESEHSDRIPVVHITDFKMYSYLAHKTAIYPETVGLYYTVLGLNGEAGEIANKVKKVLRDNGGNLTEEVRKSLLDEAGDVLWYLNELCRVLDSNLERVANSNLKKLYARREQGTLTGSGDNR